MNTKSILLIVIMFIGGIGIGVGYMVFMQNKSSPKSNVVTVAPSKENSQTLYHCPMHTTYFSKKPSDCPICGMALVAVNADNNASSSDGEKKILYYRDQSKPWLTFDKPGKASDGTDLVPVYSGDPSMEHSVKIDPVTVQNMGVVTEQVKVRNLKRDVRTGGNVEINETRVSMVNTKVMGWVEKLFVDYTGQQVTKGQNLLELYSPDLVTAQQEYLQALTYQNNLDRNATPEAKTGATNLLLSARQRLLNLDFGETDIVNLAATKQAQRSIPLYAPVSGVVLEKMVVVGQNVMPGMPLYKIADLSIVWVVANVYQDDLPFISLNQKAKIELSSQPGKFLSGSVSFISPVLDMSSKTAQVRIEVHNTKDYNLKPNMFASVQILSPLQVSAVSVPEQAVIRSGKRNIVIVSLGNGYFKPVEVQLGMSAEGYVQVVSGLHKDETIVTSSQFLIDSESNLASVVREMTAQPSNEQKPDSNAVIKVSEIKTETAKHPTSPLKKDSTTKTAAIKYICTMCPEIVSDKPGKCSKCGMFLVPDKK